MSIFFRFRILRYFLKHLDLPRACPAINNFTTGTTGNLPLQREWLCFLRVYAHHSAIATFHNGPLGLRHRSHRSFHQQMDWLADRVAQQRFHKLHVSVLCILMARFASTVVNKALERRVVPSSVTAVGVCFDDAVLLLCTAVEAILCDRYKVWMMVWLFWEEISVQWYAVCNLVLWVRIFNQSTLLATECTWVLVIVLSCGNNALIQCRSWGVINNCFGFAFRGSPVLRLLGAECRVPSAIWWFETLWYLIL
jgi:hypothetical protein